MLEVEPLEDGDEILFLFGVEEPSEPAPWCVYGKTARTGLVGTEEEEGPHRRSLLDEPECF